MNHKRPMIATLTGQKVLAGAAKGRAAIAENHALRVTAIVALFNELTAKGVPFRGMAGQIARRLKGTRYEASERHVRRIIFSDKRGICPIQAVYSPPKNMRRFST